ncbi:ABC transporter permease [Bifidobacterium sp.]|jgi:putative spermidine/putrescine transport system permease protein|uniref:ABC transporter permease n=1 Tax=Bifidobacterium sp. TaxID=41200 RepID=UPI0025BEFCA6|nr:ABC transporter permease subunit [Bifidobacterium sp.]MCH4161238.1 ABC transporter permease subunit [Bifidobacterium sp.]MCH4175503.1 ABC transporter permease subunit [Bifidobacterium sp.]MCI1635337.1 ABC transporter permease subunit [Bifidobacterium sp.]
MTDKGNTTLKLLPFVVYVVLLFVLPAALVVSSAFQADSGGFTLENFSIFSQPGVTDAFWNSVWLSALTAVLGALFGAVVCFALLGCKDSGIIHRLVDAASSTLSQFGGVMLAFAFIATLGNQGLLTLLIKALLHIDIYSRQMWLYTTMGLILPYLFFQIPLMIITFYPAISRLPRNLAEAVAMLGGNSWTYWRRVGMPVMFPSFMGGFLLLFANAFSAYATAAALISQGSQIAPLQVRAALVSETGLGSQGAAGALALGMLGIMVLVVLVYALVERKASSWLA